MANGYFERGEMYDILFGEALPGEMAAHRPGIIVSSEEGNRASPTVLMVYTTTTTTAGKDISVNHPFVMNGWKNYALCNQIATVNKNRLKNFYGRLSDSDMNAIDGCLEIALDLGYIDDTAVKEKETEIAARDIQIKELREEIAKLKAEIAAHDDNEMAVKVEIAMWQRLYEKALDQLCSMKLTGDITRRAEKALVAAPKVEAPAPVVEDEPKLIDINTAKFDELKKCGLSNNIAVSVIARRPYKSVEELKKVPGITGVIYGILSKKVCCTKVAPVVSAAPVVKPAEPDPGFERININTARAVEIAETLRISKNAAYAATAYRKKNGPFKSLDELADLPYWSEGIVEKHRDMMEV